MIISTDTRVPHQLRHVRLGRRRLLIIIGRLQAGWRQVRLRGQLGSPDYEPRTDRHRAPDDHFMMPRFY